jgi:hypothetical protein
MFQGMARRQSRWRLPAGAYNPVVTVDGRRWRDYEMAAEAPAPTLDDRPLNAHVPAAAYGGAFDGTAFARTALDDAGSFGPGSVGAGSFGSGSVSAGSFGSGSFGPGASSSGVSSGGAFSDGAFERGGVSDSGIDNGGGASGGGSFGGGPYGGATFSGGSLGGGHFGGRAGVDWFDRGGRPPRLDEARPYGRPGGLAKPDPQTQEDLAQAVLGRFPDPRGTWIRLINAGGPSEDPFRSPNAVDCALAMLSTWHGEPMVSAPTLPEYDRVGKPVLTGETGGVARAEQWLGHRFEFVGIGRRAYVAIAHRLIAGGHGAAAMLITRWPTGGSHAWNAVNRRGEILWIDAQRGHMAVEPLYEDVTGVFCVIIDHEGRRL